MAAAGEGKENPNIKEIEENLGFVTGSDGVPSDDCQFRLRFSGEVLALLKMSSESLRCNLFLVQGQRGDGLVWIGLS